MRSTIRDRNAVMIVAVLLSGSLWTSAADRVSINVTGPDLLVVPMVSWAEAYAKSHPDTAIVVGGKMWAGLNPESSATIRFVSPGFGQAIIRWPAGSTPTGIASIRMIGSELFSSGSLPQKDRRF